VCPPNFFANQPSDRVSLSLSLELRRPFPGDADASELEERGFFFLGPGDLGSSELEDVSTEPLRLPEGF